MNEAVEERVTSQVRTVGARPPRLAPASDAPSGRVIPQPEQDITVLPAVINLYIYQGDDFYLDMLVTDQNGAAVDCSQSSPMSQVRLFPDDPDILANLSVVVDSTTINLLHLHLLAADSSLLPASAAWDIQLTVPNVTTLAYGSVTVTMQVTQ
jgi:hypothetical protein